MSEKDKNAPGFIWLCFVNWVNTLEDAESLVKTGGIYPHNPSVAEFLKK